MRERIAVIVQARLHSTRLPGKVLLPLAGRSVLAHVLERCHRIEADVVCCAIPETDDCAPIAAEAERCGAVVFRGEEADVLSRYAGAARCLAADVVLRVTSDCPLIDPEVCNAVLALRRHTNADYACNNMPPSWPHGIDCEAITGAWLSRADAEAERPSEREHVTQYVRNHGAARRANLPCPQPGLGGLRWTLDTEADYRFLTALMARLPDAAARWRTVVRVLDEHPDLRDINAHEDRFAGLRKSLAADQAKGFKNRDTA